MCRRCALFGAAPALASSPNVVISQIYGGGGNVNAPYNRDYIELFNRSTTVVDLTGWSVQYTSATGTGNFGANSSQLTALSGLVDPGQYVLVQETSGAVGAGLPALRQLLRRSRRRAVDPLQHDRCLQTGSGCQDTDSNGNDFAASDPAPRNTLSTIHRCDADQPPEVSPTMPASGEAATARHPSPSARSRARSPRPMRTPRQGTTRPP